MKQEYKDKLREAIYQGWSEGTMEDVLEQLQEDPFSCPESIQEIYDHYASAMSEEDQDQATGELLSEIRRVEGLDLDQPINSYGVEELEWLLFHVEISKTVDLRMKNIWIGRLNDSIKAKKNEEGV